MAISLQRRMILAALCAFVAFSMMPRPAAAADEDVVHLVSGVVKHVDKATKTVVIKADDGTEHTIKWTGKTTWEGTKGTATGIKDGARVSVKYTEKGGEKTAVGIKDAGKDVKKAAD